MVTAIDCVVSERIEFKTCRIPECRCVALLLQLEAIIADATGSIHREHERECNVGLDRTWRLRLLLFLGPEWRRGDYQECAQGSPKHGGAPMTVISAGITAGIRHGSNAGRFSISSDPTLLPGLLRELTLPT